jgi:hypothetical protein
MMATITAKDMFGDMFSEGETAEYPLDMKVAFHHPTRSSSIIFIGGDMPHYQEVCQCPRAQWKIRLEDRFVIQREETKPGYVTRTLENLWRCGRAMPKTRKERTRQHIRTV